jgi:hypothetical protein
VIFIGHRPSEIGEHTIAKKLRNVAAIPLDRGCDSVLVGAYEVVHLLALNRADRPVDSTMSQKRTLSSLRSGPGSASGLA